MRCSFCRKKIVGGRFQGDGVVCCMPCYDEAKSCMTAAEITDFDALIKRGQDKKPTT